MKKQILLAIAIAAHGFALEDTPANRGKEADRYIQATPPKELLADVAVKMARSLPEDERQRFIDLMTKDLDIAAFSAALKTSMVKHFTADELKALADFYGSKEGKSAMKKMGVYMADIMPVIQAEVKKAVEKSKEAPTGGAPAKGN